MTPLRISFEKDGKRARGRLLWVGAKGFYLVAVVEHRQALIELRLHQIKVLKGRGRL